MNTIYKLERPDLSKVSRERLFEVLERENIQGLIRKTSQPEYVYWKKFKYMRLSEKSKPEELWLALSRARKIQSQISPIVAENKESFTWFSYPGIEEFYHEVDFYTGGSLTAFTKDIDEKNKMQFVARGILEEAIASSQLEGANTTRKLAKKFLREGRKPKNEAEQMILNNFQSMRAIEEDYKNKELSRELIFELHARIVKDTVPQKEQGRFRSDKDEIVVTDKKNKHLIFHMAPKTKFVEKEVDKLIEFSNNQLKGPFIHPVIKAVMLHFWIGYLHPFTDGNGRLARLLFYWYLMKNGYWAFAYLPISTIIKKSPAQYRDAYVYTEQDQYDLTYFINYNIRKIQLAIKDFQAYVDEKSVANKQMNQLVKLEHNLNTRQIQLLQYYFEKADEYTTPTMYQNVNQIAKRTAINDLKDLEEKGFVGIKKVGRNTFYYPTSKINELFA